jgi:succinyl-diaminopimelate desuccinylase
VYAHADVVPVSDGWQHPPFGGVIENNRMYGRGTSDDKGPALAAYYALKLLKDQGMINGYQVRLVIGGNEEKGSGCLKYYFHQLKKPYPESGFTPDGNFPLIYGEKGISNFEISGKVNWKPIHSIQAGIVANSVIDEATAVIDRHDKIEPILRSTKLPFTVTHDKTTTTIQLFGKAAHGSLPQLGVNAGTKLLSVLARLFPFPELVTLAEQYSQYNGKKLGQYYQSKLLHETTLNVGLIRLEKGVFSLVANYRYPETVVFKDVAQAITLITPKPLKFQTLMTSEPLLVQPDSPMIQTLLKAYQEETGDKKTPMVTIGGGTYAKEAKNTVAFGSKFPGKEDFIHENDEKIDLEDFTRSMSIYARAIDDLGRLHASKK